MKELQSKLVGAILAAQPLLASFIFFSVLTGKPPLWLSWTLVAFSWGLHFGRTGQLLKRTPFDIPILLFIVGIVVGYLVSPDKIISQEGLHTYLASVLIYYGIVNNTEARSSYWLLVASILCLITFGLSIWFFSQGEGRLFFFNEWAFKLAEPLPKLPGPVLHLNQVAVVLAVVIPALFAVGLFKSWLWLRLTGLVLSLGFLTFLVLVASGSGWISVTIGLTFVVLCWRLWTAGLVLPAIGYIAWLVVINYDKVSWLPQVFSWENFLGRLILWRETINLLIDRPFTGLGLGAWLEVYYGNYSGTITSRIHNSYLQLYSDTGFLGLVSLVWAAVVWLRLSRRLLSSSKQSYWYGVGVGIIGSIIAGAANAFVESTIASATIDSGTGYHYLGIPILWIWAALLVFAYSHLCPKRQKQIQ